MYDNTEPGNLATFRLVVGVAALLPPPTRWGSPQPAISLPGASAGAVLQTSFAGACRPRDQGDGGGMALLARSEQIDRAVNSAQCGRVSAFSQEVNGAVTLGTGATACIHLLPPLLQRLRQQHPLLTVGVTTGNTLDIVRAVEENRLDLGAGLPCLYRDAVWR